MKIVQYIFLLGAFTAIGSGCNKKLDVLPQNQLSSDQIKSAADVKAILFGGYKGLQMPGAFGEGFILEPDLLASDSQLICTSSFQDYVAAQIKTLVSTNVISPTIWGGAYNVINIANTVLDKINLVDSASKSTVQGEALFMRGTCYFYLAALFCKPYSDGNAASNPGAPVVLQPTYNYTPGTPGPNRGTVTATYAQAVSDLTTAITKLDSTQANYRATIFSAKGMLSRVYLSMGDYTNAAIQANDVINSGYFSLVSNFANEFNNSGNSSEDIFAIQQNIQSNNGTQNNGLSAFYIPTTAAVTGRGDIILDSAYLTLFEPNDVRGSFFTPGNGSNFSTIAGFTNKWMVPYTTIPVVRLAEMYLTRGESNLMTGGSLGDIPMNDINAVRHRSGASLKGTPTQQDFIDERFRELGYEGDRFFTLKRVKRGQRVNIGYDDVRLLYPIPQTEIDVNPNLKQNQ